LVRKQQGKAKVWSRFERNHTEGILIKPGVTPEKQTKGEVPQKKGGNRTIELEKGLKRRQEGKGLEEKQDSTRGGKWELAKGEIGDKKEKFSG